MSEKSSTETVDFEALYHAERTRIPVRELCPKVDRHFLWEGWSEQFKTPCEWLEHYAPAFHFTDEELLAARSTDPLPIACGVYFLFDDAECVYVGETLNLARRLEQHMDNGLWWTSHVYFEAPKFHVLDIEAYYIDRIKPALNAKYLPRFKYSNIVKKLGLEGKAKVGQPCRSSAHLMTSRAL